jgi:hypothetical protein
MRQRQFIVQNIWDHDAHRIRPFFKYDTATISLLKKQGGSYSPSLRCWYFDYDNARYKSYCQDLEDRVIETPTKDKTQPLAGLNIRRDLPAIATGELQLDSPAKENNPEHIKDSDSLVYKMRLELLPNLGNDWVFKMRYI